MSPDINGIELICIYIICYIDVYLLDNETTSNLLINASHEILSFDLL